MTQSAAVARSLADLGEVRRMAEQAHRGDLVARLDQLSARLTGADVPIAVVGEFKQGKSTLINALLRTDVCPVDADVVTAVPTIVRYGTPPSAAAFVGAEGETPSRVAVPFDRLREVVAGGHNGQPVRTVEVRLDRRLLRGGMTFVDTPGVGGLDSAHGNLTLGVLPLARAALFVTDAAQELTEPELDFLRRTVQGCPAVVCVMTKTDLHRQWRRIADLNRAHLARAGLPLRIVAVSSFLRLHAGRSGDDALNDESGFPNLLGILAREVLAGAESA
ncbi:dynamin family protein, partial [Actinoplanes sp. NPDC048791]|uniref:dynamin family protein n=1 Tax=Actinoplanes sp. NPDC048791 TaxID=3154623 RepID=UPI0034085361